MTEFADQRFVVTGAGGGIGAACVDLLKKSGATVIGVDLSGSSEADEHVQVDLADPAQLPLVADTLGARAIHGIVNNAAASSSEPTESISSDAWDDIFAVNVRAPFLLSEMLLPNLSGVEGAVVNVASVHAFATSVGAVPYAASKGGLVALTRALAVDWRSRGHAVRVNAVAPGATDTSMLRDGLSRTGLAVDELGRRHPLGRVAAATEIAAAVVFLLSPRSSFIHGETLVVDGGALALLSTEVEA